MRLLLAASSPRPWLALNLFLSPSVLVPTRSFSLSLSRPLSLSEALSPSLSLSLFCFTCVAASSRFALSAFLSFSSLLAFCSRDDSSL